MNRQIRFRDRSQPYVDRKLAPARFRQGDHHSKRMPKDRNRSSGQNRELNSRPTSSRLLKYREGPPRGKFELPPGDVNHVVIGDPVHQFVIRIDASPCRHFIDYDLESVSLLSNLTCPKPLQMIHLGEVRLWARISTAPLPQRRKVKGSPLAPHRRAVGAYGSLRKPDGISDRQGFANGLRPDNCRRTPLLCVAFQPVVAHRTTWVDNIRLARRSGALSARVAGPVFLPILIYDLSGQGFLPKISS